jgi:hypothetical protein
MDDEKHKNKDKVIKTITKEIVNIVVIRLFKYIISLLKTK